MIKIDVQGLEAAVIRGGLATIGASRPVMIIETPSDEVVSLLQPAGLRPVFLTDSHRDRVGL
ncbi:Uncharacterised protein [Mycobacteroides abscessus subsp. massiliense]|nr:Uncharacterised protein [Mycobacteroides abscessus subsp. massiliense]